MAEKISLVIAGGGFPLVDDFKKGAIADAVMANLPEGFQDEVEVIEWSRQPGSHYSVRMTADLLQLLAQQVEGGAKAVAAFCGAGAVEEMAYLGGLLWCYPQPLIFAAMPNILSSVSEHKQLLNDVLAVASSPSVWNNGVILCADGRIFSALDVLQVSNLDRVRFDGNLFGAIGLVSNGRVAILRHPILPQRSFNGMVEPARNVEMVYSALGSGKVFVQALVDGLDDKKLTLDGLVIAGFGSGSVYPSWIPCLKTLAFRDIPMVMVSRCHRGCVLESADFEGSFHRLKEIGIMDGGYLSPLQARLKLAVGIGAGFKGEKLQKYLLEG